MLRASGEISNSRRRHVPVNRSHRPRHPNSPADAPPSRGKTLRPRGFSHRRTDAKSLVGFRSPSPYRKRALLAHAGNEAGGRVSRRGSVVHRGRVVGRAAGAGSRPCRVTRTFCLGCTARRAAIELATSEILPSGAASAPRNSKRRSLRTHRHGGRWPDSPNFTRRRFDRWILLFGVSQGIGSCAILV